MAQSSPYLFQTTGQRSEYTPETAAKMQALERRQKIAAALIEQGMQPKPVRQAGRFVVAPSMMEQLSGPISTLAGALSSAYLDKERGEIQEAETAKVAKAMQDYAAAQADVPSWTGRTVPGTGTPAIPGSPAVPEIPESYTTQVADAIVGPPPPNVPRGHKLVDSPAPETIYTPAVPGRAAVPAQAAVPDRRENMEEALTRESFPPETIRAVMEGWRPSDASGGLKQVIEEVERPDQVGRSRTPEERRAANMALLASGIPMAPHIVDMEMRQRETEANRQQAEKFHAETIAETRLSREQHKELEMAAAAARIKEAEASRSMTQAQMAQAQQHFEATFGMSLKQYNEQVRENKAREAQARISEENRNRERMEPTAQQQKDIRDLQGSTDVASLLQANLEGLLAINPKTGLSMNEEAYSGGFVDWWRKAGSSLKPTDPRVKATLRVESLFDEKALDSLKATFGAQPSDKEGAWLQRAKGSLSMTPELRKDFLLDGITLLKAKIARNKASAEGIKNRRYPDFTDIDASVAHVGIGSKPYEQWDPSQASEAPSPTGYGFKPINQF